MLEVCVDSLESALNAVHGGTDELEVCSSLAEGGLTPSTGLVQVIQKSLANIPLRRPLYVSCPATCHCLNINKKPKVNVMIRCRPGSDFCYSQLEMDTMLEDIKMFLPMNVDSFVFGALTEQCTVDQISCVKIIKTAEDIPVTFHRAIDICEDILDALETIISLGFKRILTSGQQQSAADKKAIDTVALLIRKSKGLIEIMPGAGVNETNVSSILNTGCTIVHSSCKKVKKLSKMRCDLSMGSNESEDLFITDEEVVKDLKKVINNFIRISNNS